MRTCSKPWRANVPRAGALPRNPGAACGQAMRSLGLQGKQPLRAHTRPEALNKVRAPHPALPKNCDVLVLVLLGCYPPPVLPSLLGGRPCALLAPNGLHNCRAARHRLVGFIHDINARCAVGTSKHQLATSLAQATILSFGGHKCATRTSHALPVAHSSVRVRWGVVEVVVV